MQIAGGIWADTVGGKTVLGFGVIWWSVATALTPVAAKLGLPFLLVVRAFMGIGEVSVDNPSYRVISTIMKINSIGRDLRRDPIHLLSIRRERKRRRRSNGGEKGPHRETRPIEIALYNYRPNPSSYVFLEGIKFHHKC